MRLIPVNPSPFCYLHCCNPTCQNRTTHYGVPTYFNTNSQVTYADLDGKPFEAYYCRHCAAEYIKFENVEVIHGSNNS